MMPLPTMRAARRILRSAGDESGIAAIEFAILLPLMLLLYLGGFDLTREVDAATKTTLAARTLADLTSQEQGGQSVPASEISSLLAASAIVAAPFSSVSLTISSVDLTINLSKICCDATVKWSIAQNGQLRTCGTVLRQVGPNASFDATTIPKSIATRSLVGALAGAVTNLAAGAYVDTILVADTAYTYRSIAPAIGVVLNGPIRRQVYAIPRTSGKLTIVTPVSGLAAGQTASTC